ncbi:MAG: FAD-dependent oxidoreductase [Rhodocyclaceae bacterium]|nr:FAD-dependent oxidoreductase [Rhodocyclaceae bacterium]
MAHIVILGAGLGGMPAAYELREVLASEHKITVINEMDYFLFVPSVPWLAVGWRKRENITLPAAPHFEKRGIGFIAGRVEKIDAEHNRVAIEGGREVDYDFLVITTGVRCAFEDVPGLGPDKGYTQWIGSVDAAERAYADFRKLVANPGPVIVGGVQGASCFGPAYEYVAILDTALRQHRVRDRVPITFITAEPYIGHLGIGGVGDSKGMMEHEFRNRHIKWIANAKVKRIEPGKLFAEEVDRFGQPIQDYELPFAHAMLVPSFRGVAPVAAVEGLANPKALVIVDEHQRSPKYPNIYAAGACIALPPMEPTPVPTGPPKTGYMIESMVSAVVANIKAELSGRTPDAKATWNAFCIADFGDTGAVFIAQPQMPPRNVTWFATGRWAHWAKIAFEKYFMYKMRRGGTEPIFEKWALHIIGLARLKPTATANPVKK